MTDSYRGSIGSSLRSTAKAAGVSYDCSPSLACSARQIFSLSSSQVGDAACSYAGPGTCSNRPGCAAVAKSFQPTTSSRSALKTRISAGDGSALRRGILHRRDLRPVNIAEQPIPHPKLNIRISRIQACPSTPFTSSTDTVSLAPRRRRDFHLTSPIQQRKTSR